MQTAKIVNPNSPLEKILTNMNMNNCKFNSPTKPQTGYMGV